ncbi:PAS domain S-box protein [Halomonas stenophila]|uniref:histidine kinase n=1 Tax=Halomonas stenophila TaxID=795312 RepID=A0A7W5EPW0_9GAMM|nr:PAS domain S-box protein [Halomonas stenophila]MBB3229279.1 PAS domain S-box-containing protein [Halomonas stenophila]
MANDQPRRRQALEARIVELEARNAALDAEKRHYRWLAESTTDLISRHARDGTFLYASRAARELLGYAPEALIGACAYDLFHPADLADLLNKSPRVYHHDGFYQYTYRFRARDGHYVWFETTSRTRRDPESGELLDILCVSRDVERRLRAEANRERLARVVESTTDYVLFADDAERLFYSNEAVAGACRLCEWQFQQAGVALVQALPEDLPRVLAAPHRPRTGAGQPAAQRHGGQPRASRGGKVEIAARRSGPREVGVTVCDRGPGVADGDRERLFMPFHSGRHDGLGMGLAISHSLMEAMGGGLTLAPPPETGGARFVATLRAEGPASGVAFRP